MLINYEYMQIELPYDVISIEEFNLIEELNNHHILNLKALIDEDNTKKCIEDNPTNKQIKIIANKQVIFVGKIVRYQIVNSNRLTYLNIRASSFSYDLDIKRNRYAFVDLEKTYNDVINTVLNKYDRYNFKDNIINDKKIKDLIVQYDETDWEFLMRIASHFNTVLVVDSKSDSIRVSMGLETFENDSKLPEEFYEILKDYDYFMKIQREIEEELDHEDFVKYKVISKDFYQLGTKFNFKNLKVCITKIHLIAINGEVEFHYELSIEDAIKTEYMINKRLSGISLDGIVKKVRNNEMQLQFCINDGYEDKESNKWFSYCREISNFYVMPVIESKVHITFFTGDERDTAVTNAIRINNINNNPSKKTFSTVDGQELLMNPDMIQIAQDPEKSIQVTLNGGGSISITASKIGFSASNKIIIGNNQNSIENKIVKPKNISLSARNCVAITRSSGDSVNANEVIYITDQNNLRGIVKLKK